MSEKFKGFNTRERFGLLKALRNGWKRSGSAHNASIADEAIETIEALRRFVKAHDAVEAARVGALTMDLKEFNTLVQEFIDARKALPEWLTNE